MTEIEIKNSIDPLLKNLSEKKDLESAESVISKLVEFLGIKTEQRYLLNIPRVDAELSRFELAPGFAKQPSAFGINHDKEELIDLKLYWVKKTTKTNLSWLVGLTPNFEDSPANDFDKVGIDFIIPEQANSLIILLSNRFKIRSLEVHDFLTPTQVEIFKQWSICRIEDTIEVNELKANIHYHLWTSFDFEPINRRFYLDLVESFSVLVSHLEPKFGKKPSVMFTTRLIGRLLFIWFLRKKNLINNKLNYFQIDDPEKQLIFYKEKLELLFFETLNKEISERLHDDKLTPYLNGGLFDISSNDFFNNQNLTFPDGFFNQLFITLNKYNFTVDESSPEFQHVAIDPEMLGRIFESLLAEQIDESTGGNKKKSTGAFYTPREVVSYMCEESMIEYLKERVVYSSDRDRRLEELIRLPETIFRDQDQNKRRDWKPYSEAIQKALNGDETKSPITILDPAVGSGAFPMGMLHLLVKIYTRLDPKYEKNISQLKREILSRSLYGVDIEPTAIEICRLRSWLSIIVDITDINNVEPLPNLDFKFTCANSLIQLEDEKQFSLLTDITLKEKLISIRDEYFATSNKKRKISLQNEYEKLTHNDDLFDDKKTRQLKSYKPFDITSNSNFYDPELHHGVNTFDIIIGNPPYIGEQGNKDKFREVANSPLGKRFYQGKIDFFYFFFHLSLDYLKPSGILSFITTNYYITATAGSILRSDIRDRTTILNLLNFGMLKVFDSAKGQHNMITILKKGTFDLKAKTFFTKRGGYLGSEILTSIIEGNDPQTSYSVLAQSEIFSDGHIKLSNNSLDELLDKIRDTSQALDSIVDIDKGIETSANDIFIFNELPDFYNKLNQADQNLFKPYFKNSNINKYYINKEIKKYILYFSSETKFENFSEILQDYLLSNKTKLMKRREMESEDKWYKLHRPRNPLLFEGEAIVTSYRPSGVSFSFKDFPFYSGTDTYFVTQPRHNLSLLYILGVLNSNLAEVWFRNRGKVKGNILEMSADNIGRFPIKLPSDNDHEIVNNIIDKTKVLLSFSNAPMNNEAFNEILDQINSLVYKLYKLTDKELDLILLKQ